MFDNLKDLKKLRDLQNQLKKETVTIEKNGVSLTINGEMKIQSLSLNPDLETSEQEKIVIDCFDEAMSKIRKKLSSSFI
ncbi:MAG: YbaB/EbfC family nucleoid-associated protein [Candidatus Paceibacterota bacterium]